MRVRENMKYNIGIKYCGGCNPRYERVNTKNSLEKKIKELFERKKSSVNLGYARENEFYHCLLLIGGCGNCCMSFEEYDTACILRIKNEKDENKVLNELEKLFWVS